MSDECQICLEFCPDIVEDRQLLSCSHERRFHEKCLQKWLQDTPNCPLCQSRALSYPKQEINEILNYNLANSTTSEIRPHGRESDSSYSFAIQPISEQPSGTINLSRILTSDVPFVFTSRKTQTKK